MQHCINVLLLCLCAFISFAQDSAENLERHGKVSSSNSMIPQSKLYSTFKLDAPALTSAGVYDANGTLLRTLWSGKSYSAGTYAIEWDGKDDAGNSVNPGGKVFKVLS